MCWGQYLEYASIHNQGLIPDLLLTNALCINGAFVCTWAPFVREMQDQETTQYVE